MFNNDTNKYEGYIYQIYNPFNMKSYIGQTTRNINTRIIEHKKRAKSHTMDSPFLYQDIKDYGFDIFNVYEIDKVVADTLGELHTLLNEKEIYYISNYNSIYPNGYNISKGGHNIGEDIKIYQFDENGMLVCEYESIHDVSIKTNFDTSAILRACRENRFMAYGYFWCFTDYVPESYLNSRRVSTKTVMYDLEGNFIKVFESIREAAFEVTGDKLKCRSIQYCMAKKKHYKTAYGYIWRRYQDVLDDNGNVLLKLPEEEVIELNTNNRNKHKGKRVCKFSLDGKFLEAYNSIADAGAANNINAKYISDCLHGRQRTAAGFVWKFYDDVKDQIASTA